VIFWAPFFVIIGSTSLSSAARLHHRQHVFIIGSDEILRVSTGIHVCQ
jgi:hypothetical protein